MKNVKFSFALTIIFMALISLNLNLVAQEIPQGFVLVDGGKFIMGSMEEEREQPIHEVYIDTFMIAKYEVTQAEYKNVMKKIHRCIKVMINLSII